MNKIFKRIVVLIGGLFILLILAIVLIPFLVDVNRYKPHIEKQVSQATGHEFTLGGDLKLSLFPWVGISFSDLHFGNPEGFSEKDMVTVEEFRAKVKVLPLLSKKIEVKEFILNGARIVLETREDGTTGWQDLLEKDQSSQAPEPEPQPQETTEGGGLPITDLNVAEFAVTNSSLLWLDSKNNVRKEISDFKLTLTDLSFDRPIGIEMGVIVDQYPLSLNGLVGPVGKEPGKGDMPIDISLTALKLVKINLKGNIAQPAVSPGFDLSVAIEDFSPRKLLTAIEQPLPIEPADNNVLNKLGVSLKLSGTTEAISLSNGKVVLDDSSLNFSASAKEFSKPDLSFDLKLDQIDLDRYLPVPAEPESETEPPPEPEAEAVPAQEIDYTPLRKLILDGKVAVNHLKVKNIKAQNMILAVTARNGLLSLNPFSMDLYQGQMRVVSNVNVQKQRPRTDLKLTMNSIQAGALIGDFLEKDILEGELASNIHLTLVGDTPDLIRKTINGSGKLEFKNGAIKGVDLAAMAHNTAAAFGLVEKGKDAPKTEFTELLVPFKITQGVFDTKNTNMKSPALHMQAAGNANLVTEKLNFRIEPKFVNPLKGQSAKEKKGFLVPIVVSGTFQQPKYKPDLKAALEHNLGVDVDKEAEKVKEDVKKAVEKEIEERFSGKKGEDQLEKTKEKLNEEAKKFFKGLPFSK